MGIRFEHSKTFSIYSANGEHSRTCIPVEHETDMWIECEKSMTFEELKTYNQKLPNHDFSDIKIEI